MSRATAGSLRVRVPASSANLGPGFDVLAAALDLVLRVRAEPYDGRRVVCTGEGAAELPAGDDNLVWRAVLAFCEALDVAAPQVTLHCDSQIPLQRGLGSSAAAAVAGVTVASRLTGVRVGDRRRIELATLLEGHPDNAAAAVLGGVVVAGPGGAARRFAPTRDLRPIVCVPAQRSSTTATRGLVPTDVPVATMVAAARGTALVLAGLTGMSAWDPTAMRDAVAEPPRLAAMPGSRRLIQAARTAGHGACLSGAGPSVLVVVPHDAHGVADWLSDVAGPGWRVHPAGWDGGGARDEARVETLS